MIPKDSEVCPVCGYRIKKKVEIDWSDVSLPFLKEYLKNRGKIDSIYDFYSLLTDEERRKWREIIMNKGLEKLSKADKIFVGIEAYDISKNGNKKMKKLVDMQKRGKNVFNKIYREWRRQYE